MIPTTIWSLSRFRAPSPFPDASPVALMTTGAPTLKVRNIMESHIHRTVEEVAEQVKGGALEMIAMGGDMRVAARQIHPEWDGQELIRLQFDGDKVVHEERLLGELNKRIRDVRQGPDGALYLLTDANNGRILRISPAK